MPDGDDRFVTIDGSRWRRGDPAVPDAVRAELVSSSWPPGGRWRTAMATVRDVAAELAEAGDVVGTQRGEPVSLRSARGPVRLALVTDRPTR